MTPEREARQTVDSMLEASGYLCHYLNGSLIKFLCFERPKYTPPLSCKRRDGTFGSIPQVLYTIKI